MYYTWTHGEHHRAFLIFCFSWSHEELKTSRPKDYIEPVSKQNQIVNCLGIQINKSLKLNCILNRNYCGLVRSDYKNLITTELISGQANIPALEIRQSTTTPLTSIGKIIQKSPRGITYSPDFSIIKYKDTQNQIKSTLIRFSSRSERTLFVKRRWMRV